MWIILRIVAALLGGLYRWAAAFSSDKPSQQIGNIEYSETRRKNKRGDTTYHRIGVRLTGNVIFAMTKESLWDGFYKQIGFSREFQTGNREFDEHIYIASDHPEFCEALRDNAALRTLVRDLLTNGFEKIWSDGRMLYAAANESIEPGAWVPRLDRIRGELAGAAASIPGRFGDPFVWRALMVESVVWGMAGYAAVAVVDYWFHRHDQYLDRIRLITYGAVCAGIAGFGLLALIVLFLKRSSRSHRILLESGVLLALATPVLGVQLVADIDRAGVESSSIVVRSHVTNHWREEHRSRKKRRRWYSYHMRVSHVAGAVPISGEIEVTSEVFRTLADGAEIPIEIGRGRLGLHWYQSINGIPVAR